MKEITIAPPGLSRAPPPEVLSIADLPTLKPKLTAVELEATSTFTRQHVIGGTPIPEDNNPYQWATVLVMVREGTSIPFCSGALIGPRLVLTAAHCAKILRLGDAVFVGGTNFENDPGVGRAVTARAIHQCFDEATKQHDIAAVQLAAQVPMQPLRTAAAGTAMDQPPQRTQIVAWGRGSAPGTQEVKQLQSLDIALVDRATCSTDYPSDTITENMLCAGTLGSTTCYGDSGGPLIVNASSADEAIGIASFTNSCVVSGVFSRVSAYTQWLGGLSL